MGDMLWPSMRIALAILMVSALPAHAALNVCNKSAGTVRVAVAKYDGAEWTSKGWWTLAPRTCATVVPSVLDARYYYLFASDGSSGNWSGSRGFCVTQRDKFEIRGRADCAARGYERKEFFEVDTGPLADYTQSLAD